MATARSTIKRSSAAKAAAKKTAAKKSSVKKTATKKSATKKSLTTRTTSSKTKSSSLLQKLAGASSRKRTSSTKAETKSVLSAEEFFAQKELRGTQTVLIEGEEVTLTNLQKVYWPKDGFTKGDLLKYYWEAADYIIPYLKDRPLILKRYPNGITGTMFYQHDLQNPPSFLKTYVIPHEGEKIHYALVEDRNDLIYLANLGTIAQNPFHSRIGDLSKPDWFVFDLDPGDKATYSSVCKIALKVRDILKELGLRCYPKTSGSTGIHLYVPIKAAYSYDDVVDFAKEVARRVAEANPAIATIERYVRNRKPQQVYVDYLQNLEGKSIAAPYAVREKPGATVSAPLTWSEVEKCVKLSNFTIETMPLRLRRKGDLFKKVLTDKQPLDRAIKKL